MKHHLVISQLLTTIILVFVFLATFLFARFHFFKAGEVMVVSASSDGDYAITTDLSRKAILWDLKNHTKKILDRNANIYSAYFIKNSNNFMWQHDSDNVVMIENTSGQIIKKFNPGFPTYGEIITTNLRNYIASDEEWNIKRILFINDENPKKSIIKKGLWAPDFLGAGKLMNLTISFDESYLLTSGLADDDSPLSAGMSTAGDKHWSRSKVAGVMLWDITTGQPLQKHIGNVYKTFATLSPDGKYVVAGDENTLGFIWETRSGKKILALNDIDGIGVKDKNGIYHADTRGFLPVPNIFKNNNPTIFSIKFADNTHYLRFTTYIPYYAILYSVADPKPLKYLPLGNSPMISVDQYTRDQSIDTSPQAHILVTGKINAGGILVYQYDPKTQTLNKVWNGG